MDADHITFIQTPLETILPLRDEVLIRGTGRSSPEFPGDRDPATMHFAATRSGQVVSCATMMLNEWEGAAAWQLRGMATAPECRSQGIGARLLSHIETALKRDGRAFMMWCNARTVAVTFYERNGWRVASGPFDVEGVGPHVKMVKPLA